MIVDSISNWRTYRLGEAWEKAFAFLENLEVGAEEKEYPIDGDEIFARVMSYPTKNETDTDAVLEAHRKYVDIQMSLIGSERIAVYPLEELETKDAYDADRDVEFFKYQKSASIQVGNLPGAFTVLLPQDAHMPQLFTEEKGAVVKKVVVKVLLSRLELG